LNQEVNKLNIRLDLRNITRLKRSVRAISPVIATLLMIAITVVASLVTYAWISGYIGGTVNKVGASIEIQSFAGDQSGNLVVYVQNVGQGVVTLNPNGAVYVNDSLLQLLDSVGNPLTSSMSIAEGQTVALTVHPSPNGYNQGDYVQLKVVTSSGASALSSGKGSGGQVATNYSVSFSFGVGGQSVSPSGTQSFSAGTRVPIVATPDANYEFTQWTSTTSTGSIIFDNSYAASTVATINGAGSITATFSQNSPKIVYVVINVDSEMYPNGMDQYVGSTNPHPTMDVREYSRTSPSTVAAVLNSDFRNYHRDSFGNSFKMSWFAEMDYLVSQGNFVWADGSSAGVSGYTAIRDLLMNVWGTEIQTNGDSIEYHHHFVTYDGTWQHYDDGPDAGYPEYQMYALDHMIIDRDFYPSTWRSGRWIMPPALSPWLEQWMPFDYTPTTGIWYPVHPIGMDRWQTACPYAPDVIGGVNSAFAYASQHGSAIYSLCTHEYENMQMQIEWLHYNLNTADANEAAYPNVQYKYVTAQQAMQLALGVTDFTPPSFTITPNGNAYTIVSSEPLWENHPYVALKYTDGTYGHMNAILTGTNTWTITPPRASELSSIGVAASDLKGNPGATTYSIT
jgi:archaeal type IV pilus assembly protein PilA